MSEKKTVKWSKLILVASLGLNLIVVGLVAGAWLNGPKFGGRDQVRSVWSSGPYGRALSKEDRRDVGKILREDTGLRQRRGEMRQIGIKISAALRADPFDVEALKVLFDRQADLGAQMTRAGQDALLQRISEMSPEQRVGFADRLEKGMKRGRRKN